MTNLLTVLVGVYVLLNGLAFGLMLDDKERARRGARRLPEAHLLFAALAGGALGLGLGMLLCRHKTRKLLFVVGVPLALGENLCSLYMLGLLLPA